MRVSGFFLRWLFALAIVFITYNPTQYSLFHWLWPFNSQQIPLKILTSLVMLIVYIVFLRATFRSIGILGVVLALALSATILWVFIDQGWLNLENHQAFKWIFMIIIGSVLGIGISWSHIRRKLTGQFDTDDVEH